MPVMYAAFISGGELRRFWPERRFRRVGADLLSALRVTTDYDH